MTQDDDRPTFQPVPLNAQPGYQAVVEYLQREIILGRIRPGDKLPAERRLAGDLGVSRETLRQALRILQATGQIVVTRGAGGGPIVQDVVGDQTAIRADIRARSQEMLELTEFRRIIECAAAELAATRHSDADLALMRAAQAELSAAVSKPESRTADTAFHLAVAHAAGNEMLATAIEDARVRMFRPLDALSFEFVKEASIAAHQKILDAIVAGDVEAAGRAMRDHLCMTRDEFERLVGEDELSS